VGVKRCRVRRCGTILVAPNEHRGRCYRHQEDDRRMRFLRNMPGADQLTVAERRRWIRGDAEQTTP